MLSEWARASRDRADLATRRAACWRYRRVLALLNGREFREFRFDAFDMLAKCLFKAAPELTEADADAIAEAHGDPDRMRDALRRARLRHADGETAEAGDA